MRYTRSISLFLLLCLLNSSALFATAHQRPLILTAKILTNTPTLKHSAASASDSALFGTKIFYNGTFANTYEGVMQACEKERSGSIPCTDATLMAARFWLQKIWPPMWVNGPQVNCVGWSTDSENTVGMCVQTTYGVQEIPCSCDMALPVCCHEPANSPEIME